MPELERRCGNCRWWKADYPPNEVAAKMGMKQSGFCQFFKLTLTAYKLRTSIPFWARSNYMQADVERACPTWEAKP